MGLSNSNSHFKFLYRGVRTGGHQDLLHKVLLVFYYELALALLEYGIAIDDYCLCGHLRFLLFLFLLEGFIPKENLVCAHLLVNLPTTGVCPSHCVRAKGVFQRRQSGLTGNLGCRFEFCSCRMAQGLAQSPAEACHQPSYANKIRDCDREWFSRNKLPSTRLSCTWEQLTWL